MNVGYGPRGLLPGVLVATLLGGCASPMPDRVPVEDRSISGAQVQRPRAAPVEPAPGSGAQVQAAPAPAALQTRPLETAPLRPVEPLPAEPRPEFQPATAPPPEPVRGPRSGPSPGGRPPADAGGPAVVALLDSAYQQQESGSLSEAAASLERALRIEPRNAMVWHQLAVVRFRQGQLDQAEQMALKSEALAGTDNPLRARNWRLIALVRQQRGDAAGARAAQSQADALGSR